MESKILYGSAITFGGTSMIHITVNIPCKMSLCNYAFLDYTIFTDSACGNNLVAITHVDTKKITYGLCS